MNPKVALVILIVLVVLACVALGLTFTADGMDDFGESSGKPEDSNWSETLTEKMMKEVVISPSLARAQTTEPDADGVQITASPAGCVREKPGGSAVYVSAVGNKKACSLTLPALSTKGDKGFPKRGIKRVFALKSASCSNSTNLRARWKPKLGKTVQSTDGDWDDWIPVTKEGGELTLTVQGGDGECTLTTASRPPK